MEEKNFSSIENSKNNFENFGNYECKDEEKGTAIACLGGIVDDKDLIKKVKEFYKRRYKIDFFEQKFTNGVLLWGLVETYDPLINGLQKNGFRLEKLTDGLKGGEREELNEKYESVLIIKRDENLVYSENIPHIDDVLEMIEKGQNPEQEEKTIAIFVRDL